MTENMKNFLAKVSEDPELAKKISKLDKKDLIAAAKEQGFTITEADLEEKEGAVSEDELNSVAGGGSCTCVGAGGGTSDENDKACGCVAAGFGNDRDGEIRCRCILGGGGTNNA